jgi:selenocysteine lyase/cysteine desulfurase
MAEHEPPPKPLTIVLPPILDETAELPAVSPSAAPAPYLPGGGAVRQVTAADIWWTDSPDRHEAGSPNVLGAHALATACTGLDRLPAGELARHDHGLRTLLLDGLADLGRVQVHRLWTDTTNAVGLITFTGAGHPSGLVAACSLSPVPGPWPRPAEACAWT